MYDVKETKGEEERNRFGVYLNREEGKGCKYFV